MESLGVYPEIFGQKFSADCIMKANCGSSSEVYEVRGFSLLSRYGSLLYWIVGKVVEGYIV